MQSLTRRLFMRRAAAALPAVAVGTGATAAVAPVAAPLAFSQTEDASLLALGEQIAPLLAAYREALARHTEARALAEANCPQVPEELVCKNTQWAGCTEREQDVEGKDVRPPAYIGADGKTYARPPRNVLNSVATKAAIKRGNLYCDGRTKFGKRLRSLIRTAERYEAEREAAIDASGIRSAADELFWAATDIDVLAWKIREFAPVTVDGVMIHARALAAHAESELHSSGFSGRAGLTLGRQLADAVLRITGGFRAMAVQS